MAALEMPRREYSRAGMRRREFLTLLGTGALGGCSILERGALLNPCRGTLPEALANHPLVRAAWQDVNPANCWDVHAHIAGTGDSGPGIELGPRMKRPLRYPVDYLRRFAYMNAACTDHERVDLSYMERLRALTEAMPRGYKVLLYAFDHFHDTNGDPRPDEDTFYVANDHAAKVAGEFPAFFEWVASVHPYRPDALGALERVAKLGARAVKWLPAAMNIDPGADRCVPYYNKLAALGLPLITHAGEERAVHGGDRQAFNNPLKLRLALEKGVRVIVAHCASTGDDLDLDAGANAPRVTSFELFARMMESRAYEGHLFGDISAVPQSNRRVEVIRAIVERTHWHGRLLNGSDYPLPGVLPLFSTRNLARNGLIDEAAVSVLDAIQEHSPLLFDFVLKRSLRSGSSRFPATVFETRRIFDSRGTSVP